MIVSCDDLGSCHAANVGVYDALRIGAATCASIMVPAPWAEHAAHLALPTDDIGVHLTLNAEHELYRWGPITHAPSLQSGEGGFPRSLEDLWEHADPAEVLRELPRPDRAGHRLGHRRDPSGTAPHGDHAATRVLRRLSGVGGRVPRCRSGCRRPSRPSRPASRSASWRAEEGVVFPDHFDHDWRAGSARAGVRRHRCAGVRRHRDPRPTGDRHAGGPGPRPGHPRMDRRPRPRHGRRSSRERLAASGATLIGYRELREAMRAEFPVS